MSSDHEPQHERPERDRRATEQSVESVGPEPGKTDATAEVAPPLPPAGLDHPTALRRQRAGVIQLQRSHGNRYVARRLAQRQGDEPPSGDEPGPAQDAGASPGLIVDDGTPPGPGQMAKTEFLTELRAAADETVSESASFPTSLMAGAEIDRQFAAMSGLDGPSLEREIKQQAPEAAGAAAAHDYIPMVRARLRQNLESSGEAEGTPDTAAALNAASTAGGGPGFPATAPGLVSRFVGLFLKSRSRGSSQPDDPEAIQRQLGSGRVLDGQVRTQMESAFGRDFSDVRVHTDDQAAQLSAGLDARAFTIGRDVAFGSGEYQPGSPIGDALIAHELAHVAQQGGATAGPMTKSDEAEYGALEEDADLSAVEAVTSIWGRSKEAVADIGRRAMPTLRSGLRLQRCVSGGKSRPPGTASVHPTAIASTRVTGATPSLGPTYYGSIFEHTLTTSGGTITADITIAELVTVTRDDFATGFAGVPLGTLTWGPGGTAPISGNTISDNIGTGTIDVTSFMPSPPKPGLPAVMITPQQLHYRIGTCAWVKFADVPMTVTLRTKASGGYEVETNVNGVPSVQPYTGPV